MANSKEVILADGVRERLTDLERKIQFLKSELPILEVHRKVLLSLLDSTTLLQVASDNGQAEQIHGPTQAVLSFVKAFPGVTTGRIAHELENRIKSESPNRKQIIYTVLSQLRQQGRLQANEDGRHYIVEVQQDE